MSPTVTDLRAVTFFYAILGGLFFACAFMLVIVTWSSSWSHLWHVIGEVPQNSIAWCIGFALEHFGMAALSLRYLTLGRLGRRITFVISLFFAVRNFNGAVMLTKAGTPEAWILLSMPIVIGLKWLLNPDIDVVCG
jgi:hypothetical protein